jgi:hypothetical protein
MLVAAVLAALGLTSRATAQITAFWHRASISPAAIAEEPALANMQSWDLFATTSGNWLSARMAARLPAGVTYYKHPLGGLTRPDPSMFNSSPALQFTTYASAANDTGTNHTTLVLGSFLFNADPASIGDATSPLPGVFDMMWGNSPPTAPPGTYQIARLTFAQGVLPEVLGSSATTQLNREADTFIPQIPEPNLGRLGGAIALVLLRRRPMAP